MTVTLAMEAIPDEFGVPYLACDIDPRYLDQDLRQLSALIGAETTAAYGANLLARNGGAYHITIVSPPECVELGLDPAMVGACRFTFHFLGLGRAAREGEETFYTVCESAEVQDFRRSLRLPRRDLHVTLAFRNEDIHGVPKGRETLVRLP